MEQRPSSQERKERLNLEKRLQIFNDQIPGCSIAAGGVYPIYTIGSDKTPEEITAMLDEIYPSFIANDPRKFCAHNTECKFRMDSEGFSICSYYETYSFLFDKYIKTD